MTDIPLSRVDKSPEREDRDLFRTYGGPIEVALVPRMHHTDTGDFVARGFFGDDCEITVLFPGRRASEIGPLEAYLRWLDGRARRAAVAAQRPSPNPDLIRLALQIKGAWRVVPAEHSDTPEAHQLIAARWAFKDQSGALVQFGEAPAYDMLHRKRPKSYILSIRETDPSAGPKDDKGGAAPRV
ncbi:hypothetical protein [Roseobacter sp.]|uniref:hypothetical protein n=1 Tax=Roseobacter sp. TaxID=1907202 RepID=UPI0032985867